MKVRNSKYLNNLIEQDHRRVKHRLGGLATLTHTPSPMGFLTNILVRGQNERPFVLIPVGFPSADATVPAIPKKALGEVMEVR